MTRLLIITCGVICFLAVQPAPASKRRLVINLQTVEGSSLKHLSEVPDAAAQTALLEAFAERFPEHESASWVLGELQRIYLQDGKFARAIAVGEAILAGDPDDLVIAHGNLRGAEGASDDLLIRKWAATALQTARRVLMYPKPTDAQAITVWQSEADYAKKVESACEYALYSLALRAKTPGERLLLSDSLEKQSPASPYGAQLRQRVFLEYQQAGDHSRALAMAEEDIRAKRANEDMLLYAAGKAYERQEKGKVTVYAKRLIETLTPKPAPDGVNPADWVRTKKMRIGLAQWMLGIIASSEQRWPDADIHLRAALPNVTQNKEISAETLYHLGLANFKLGEAKSDKGRIADALKFNLQCAAIASNFQAQAKQNAASIRSQFHLQ